MNYINFYDKLATKDVRELKKGLIWWAENVKNGILLFDTTAMEKIYQRMQEQKVCGNFHKDECELWIEDLAIDWKNIGGTKGVLEKIYWRGTCRFIYVAPLSWENASLWYEFK